MERQVAALAGRAPADAANSEAAGDLASRLQKLEAQMAQMVAAASRPAPDPALASRIAAIEAQLKSLGETVGSLGQRSDSTAAANAAPLSELTQKLARSDTPGVETNDTSDETSNANAAR